MNRQMDASALVYLGRIISVPPYAQLRPKSHSPRRESSLRTLQNVPEWRGDVSDESSLIPQLFLIRNKITSRANEDSRTRTRLQ